MSKSNRSETTSGLSDIAGISGIKGLIMNSKSKQPKVRYYGGLAGVFGIINNGRANKPNNESEKSWIKQNWKKALGISVFAGAAALSFTGQYGKELKTLEKDAPIAGPAIIGTEALAWGGAALIFASAGNKIGNPLTLKSRLEDIRTSLEHNRLYRSGISVNVLGAAGTAAVVGAAAVLTEPVQTWPLAFTVGAASLGFSSLPWVLSGNNSNTESNNTSTLAAVNESSTNTDKPIQ